MACGTSQVTLSVDGSTIEPADIENDPALQQIAAKFEHDVTITADTDLEVDPSEVVPQDSDSSNSSSVKDDEFYESSDDSNKPKQLIKNSEVKIIKSDKQSNNGTISHENRHVKPEPKSYKMMKGDTDESRDSSETQSVNSKHGCSPIKNKNPLKMLRRLTKFDKSRKQSNFRSEFAVVSVDRLPQVFVVKYLGHREVKGVSGLHHVRKPVDEMVAAMKTKLNAKEEVNLPLLYAIISTKGLDLRLHQSNKAKSTAPTGVIPINFISYGVQDIKYWRIFTCIIVKALSWQSKVATCHAFMCDSAHNGRRMALALGAAFDIYSKKLQTDGRNHSFQVELRPPDELADEMHEYDV